MPAKKRQGDTAYSSNKKRRKNETPPPSRRPQGPPNVPPPRPTTPPIKVTTPRSIGHMKEIAVLNDILEDKIDIDDFKDKEMEKIEKAEKILENGISPEKRFSGKAVNKQLRKMQEMHKNKLSKGTKVTKADKGTGLDEDESSSPISILRTSFANEETMKILDVVDEEDIDVGSKRKLKEGKKDEIPAKRAQPDVMGVGRQILSSKDCRLLLQSYRNTKLRMEAWKEVRNFKGNCCFLAIIITESS